MDGPGRRGGIGRHPGLKIPYPLRMYGFDPRRRHQTEKHGSRIRTYRKLPCFFGQEGPAMKIIPLEQEHYGAFHSLMTAYYREGEDVQTPQEELDAFIGMLFDLCMKGTIGGAVAMDGEAAGFVLYGFDTEGFPFSNKPGYGTILEIGLLPAARLAGAGRALAEYAERELACERYYVCAYGPAERFWEKCRYRDTGVIAKNGLKIFEKP